MQHMSQTRVYLNYPPLDDIPDDLKSSLSNLSVLAYNGVIAGQSYILLQGSAVVSPAK